ncbi:protein RTM1 [Rhypophila sp. PSN 637]
MPSNDPEAGAEGLKSNFFLYQYEPSVAAAALFIGLFAVTTALHGPGETVGFVGRTYSVLQNPVFTLGPYVVQAILLLVAPALFAASTYMELGKLSDLVEGHSYLLLSRRWITRTLVTDDVICFLMQAGSAGLMASKDIKTRDSGANIVIVFFGGFVITSLVFHSRVRNNPTARSEAVPYQRHLMRSSSSKAFGYIISHEAFLYDFVSVLMLLVMLLF